MKLNIQTHIHCFLNNIQQVKNLRFVLNADLNITIET